MKILATRIAKELKNAKHCAVYEPELTRVWPDGQNRDAQITSFAKSVVGGFAIIAMGSAQSLIKSRLAEKLSDGAFSKARFPEHKTLLLTLLLTPEIDERPQDFVTNPKNLFS